MSLLHIALSPQTQIFIVGFFAAMMTLWPVCMLFLMPYDLFLARDVLTQQYLIKQARLEKDNDQLRLALIDHKAIIDALLKEQMNK
jgi:hypothetical protein